ncbi:hypothetical protein [Azospirillum sp. SYSU D00513]|nr:hypothetical protein [Azospirillum sp. SYSU D00513]
MADTKPKIVRSETQARQATTPHVTRYVLGIGLPLAILAFIVVALFF